MKFLDRTEETATFNRVLHLDRNALVVVYGRRRVGKSTLIKHVLVEGDVYHLCEEAKMQSQIDCFSNTVAYTFEGFNKVRYEDWETILLEINRYVPSKMTVCIDEFPYLLSSCASLPSIIQRLIDNKSLHYNLILCGSSQSMMHGRLLDETSPLYQRADWQPKIRQLRLPYIREALGCNDIEAVEEYAVWGGVPRYWVLRADYKTLYDALMSLLLNNNGVLYEEPVRLLRDERRDTALTSSLLALIGNGVNRISELAGRVNQPATSISQPLGVLTDLGFVEREVPFGENLKKSKKGIYHLGDNFLMFYYAFIQPYKFLIELDRQKVVMGIIKEKFAMHVGKVWEKLCRDFVTGNTIDGITYSMASRWWGKIPKRDNPEILEEAEFDVVAESLDGKHVFVGECKWSDKKNATQVYEDLIDKAGRLPFIRKDQTVHTALFLKRKPEEKIDFKVFTPEMINAALL